MSVDTLYLSSIDPVPVQGPQINKAQKDLIWSKLVNSVWNNDFTNFSISSGFFPLDNPSEIPLSTASSNNGHQLHAWTDRDSVFKHHHFSAFWKPKQK